MGAYRCLGHIALGLADGTALHLRPGDYVPPSWAAINGHQTSQWLADKNVVLVEDPDPAALKAAEAVLAPAGDRGSDGPHLQR